MGKGAKESSLFIFWVNLCLQNGSCWMDQYIHQFILGTEQWRQEMGGDVFWRGAATMNKFNLGFFKRIQPHSIKHFFQNMQSMWRSAPGKLHQHAWAPPSFPRIVDERFTRTQPTSLQVTSVLSPPLTFKKTIGPEDSCIVTLETHQQHFWALLCMFVHAGNQGKVNSGGSYVLYEACRSGLTLQYNWSQALTLNLETQSWIFPSFSPSQILPGSLHGCSVLWSL